VNVKELERRYLELLEENNYLNKIVMSDDNAIHLINAYREIKELKEKIKKLKIENLSKEKVIVKEKIVYRDIVKTVIKREKRKTNPNIIQTKKYKEFRQKILERDNHKCQECGSSYRLQVHHLKPKSKYPELIMEPSNCITLCITCHSKTDNFFI
jgi:hypothetical protein